MTCSGDSPGVAEAEGRSQEESGQNIHNGTFQQGSQGQPVYSGKADT